MAQNGLTRTPDRSLKTGDFRYANPDARFFGKWVVLEGNQVLGLVHYEQKLPLGQYGR